MHFFHSEKWYVVMVTTTSALPVVGTLQALMDWVDACKYIVTKYVDSVYKFICECDK